MLRRLVPLAPLVLALAGAAACVTIQVSFPAARIQNLAEQIETEVQRRGSEVAAPAPAPAPADPAAPPPAAAPASPERSGLHLLEIVAGVRPAWAGEDVPEPSVTSPAIRRLIESRAARVGQLNRWKSAGAIGEGNDALLVVRALDAVADLAERASLRRVVDAENADRRLLFDEIAAAEGVDRAQLPRIQATYAQTLRRHARPGDWIQMPDGQWTQATAP